MEGFNSHNHYADCGFKMLRYYITPLFVAFILWKSTQSELSTIENVERLTKLATIVPHPLTVTGFSSGASMAHQLHVSCSERFDGLGVFTGVFYRCAGDTQNVTACWNGSRLSSDGIADAIEYETQGLIDSLVNLENDKIFFWLGTLDDANPQIEARLGVIDFYQQFLHSPKNIETKLQAAYHLLPTNSVPQPCTMSVAGPPYYHLGNCNYSGSYESLSFLIGPSVKFPTPEITLHPLRSFDQSEFFGGLDPNQIGLDETGYLYVPTSCVAVSAHTSCLLHVFFHGCWLQREILNASFIEKSGYLEVAEENNIVMLFPQTKSIPGGINRNGCWDYFGYTGEYYATKQGPQIVAVNKMLDRLLGLDEASGWH